MKISFHYDWNLKILDELLNENHPAPDFAGMEIDEKGRSYQSIGIFGKSTLNML